MKLVSWYSLLLFGYLIFQANGLSAQVSGLVVDQDTRYRLGKVFIYNPANDEGVYNNFRGEFMIDAQPGDILIAAVEQYFIDTLTVPENKVVIFSLKRSSILLPEVSIVMVKTPEARLKENMEKFSKAYTQGARGDFLTVGPTGAGLSIDAIYNLFSGEAKNARRLQKIIEQDYQESVIDYKFSKDLVADITGLTADSLIEFMQQYRPSYLFVSSASEYQLAEYLRKQFAQYKRNPVIRRLPPLKERFRTQQ